MRFKLQKGCLQQISFNEKIFYPSNFIYSIAQAKGIIGSPEVSINTSGNYLISIQINNLPSLSENDIELNDFKSNDPLSETALEYLLFEDMDVFKRLTLALPVNFQDTYFSFRLRAGESNFQRYFYFFATEYS